MEWQEIIDSLRKELDYVEDLMKHATFSDEAKTMGTKRFITTFAQNLYPEQEDDSNGLD